MRTASTTRRTMDIVVSRRVFNACWLSASLGVSVIQMRLLAQAWHLARHALVPACLVSAWTLGSLVGTRLRIAPRVWGSSYLACALLWLAGPSLASWRLPLGVVPPPLVSMVGLASIAFLLGASSAGWLVQQRAWPVVGERTALARSLVGLTVGLVVAWMLPVLAGLISLACCLPLFALGSLFSRCAPLPRQGGVAAAWIGRYWAAERGQLQLDLRALRWRWWWSCLVERSRDSQWYLPLSLLASGVAVILGGVWGAVPTPFAASLGATRTLDKLVWLLGGQLVILVLATRWLVAARNVIGFPDRLVPVSVRSRVRTLALLMPLAMAGGLVALGLPFLQAPWWLAVSLAGYTLAGAVWGILLPRLRPPFAVAIASQRHLSLAHSARPLDPLRLAHGRACEACTNRLFATAEGVLVALCTPLLGWLIDESGSIDPVLVIVGLVFALGLACSLVVFSTQWKQATRRQRTTSRLAVALEALHYSSQKENDMLGKSTPSNATTANLIPAQGHGRRLVQRKRRLLAALEAVIERGATTGQYVQGACVAALEERIEERWNVGAAIAVNSGSSALRLAFEALRIEAGREVIVPALTFISTAYAASDAGLVPVFVDVDPQTLTIDPRAAQVAVTEKTAAIVPVHLHGQMADMLPLLDLADTCGLYVIEDAAQAHGATYACSSSSVGKVCYAGSMGDLGCFSLNGVKNMGGLGDGGMVTVSARLLARDRAVAERLRALRDLGRVSGARYIHDEWGMRARMDEFTALECLSELPELDAWNARHSGPSRPAMARRWPIRSCRLPLPLLDARTSSSTMPSGLHQGRCGSSSNVA